MILTISLLFFPLLLWPLYRQSDRPLRLALVICGMTALACYAIQGSYRQEAWLSHLDASEVKEAQKILASPKSLIAKLSVHCDNQDAQGCYHLSTIHLAQNNLQAAWKAIEKGYKLDPQNGQITQRHQQLRQAINDL